MRKTRGNELYKRALSVVPGGTQLFSKTPTLFSPNSWPVYFSKSKGSQIWDLDNQEYTDMSLMGVGACILGYADDFVDAKVKEAISLGIQSTLICREELLLAEKLIELHPWFDMARFCRSGGEAISIAVRIARAETSREIVLFNGYHGWNDWYMAANLIDDEALDSTLMSGLQSKGVPKSLAGTSFAIDASKPLEDTLEKLCLDPRSIAAIVLEPARGAELSKNTIERIRQFCDKHGQVLIFDEITSGFRVCAGGVHRSFNSKPDIAVFAKSLGNGYPIAAIVGKRDVMSAAEETFISSTNWTERIGPSAALATIEKYESENVHEKISAIGKGMKNIWEAAFKKHQINAKVSGIDALPYFELHDQNRLRFINFLVTEFVTLNTLAYSQFKPSFAHSYSDLVSYELNLEIVLQKYNDLGRNIENYPEVQSNFKRIVYD